MSFYKEVPGRKTTLESTLKFDTEPKAGSTNPVTSDGVKSAIDGAVGDAAAALQEQIDDIAEKAGSGYTPKGPASVATLNGLSGQENGELYTMTDAGTLTLGSLAVVAGDTVAWDATNEVWYKAMDYAPRQLVLDVDDLKEDVKVLPTKANQVPNYTEIAGTISDGTIDAYDLPITIENTGSDFRHARITSGFSAGEKIYITYHCGGNWRYRIGFFSSSARLETYYVANETGYYKEFVVPEGCTEIRINGTKEVLPRAYKIASYNDLLLYAEYDENNDFNVSNIFKRISDLQKQTPFTWKITKPTITFVFDDSLADIEEVYNLFKTKGVPCCFATIPSRLNAYVLGGTSKTVADVLTEAQADGFEVLNHGITPITSASTDANIYNMFYGNKKKLVDAGFNVDGMILVGGTGSDTFDPLRVEPYLRRYYSYSDNYGKNLNAPQYYSHNRAWMTSTLNTNKGFIDSAVSNTSWVMLSAHEVDSIRLGSGIGLDVLSDTIDYAIAQGCDILTMREVFNNSL